MNKSTASQALEMMTGMSDIGDLIEPFPVTIEGQAQMLTDLFFGVLHWLLLLRSRRMRLYGCIVLNGHYRGILPLDKRFTVLKLRLFSIIWSC